MTSVERARELCRQQGKRINQMEKDCGFANGYFNPKKTQTIAGDRVLSLAEYLGVSVEYLLTGEEKNPAPEGREELIRLFEAASPELQAAALAVLKSAEVRSTAPDAGRADK